MSAQPESPPHPWHRAWGNAHEVAAYSDRHYSTVIRALRSGELHGHQRSDHGRWRIHIASVDAWIAGQADTSRSCECNDWPRSTVTSMRARR